MTPAHSEPRSIRKNLLGFFSSCCPLLVSAFILGTASVVFGGTVQITQVGNEVGVDVNLLNADLTGDDIDDLVGLEGETTYEAPESGDIGFFQTTVRAFLNNGAAPETPIASAGNFSFIQLQNEVLVVVSQGVSVNLGGSNESSPVGLDRSGFFPVTFSDARINAGLQTNGLLEVRATASLQTPSAHTVRLVRLVFDDASVVAPADAIVGETVSEFDPSIYAQRAAQAAAVARLAKFELLSKAISARKKKIKSTTRKLLSAEKRNQASKVSSLSRLIRNLRKQIQSLQAELNSL